ncbi:MAG: hypothetical protein R6V05_11510, partial [Candidatus Brocadiia bacterium]
MSERLGIQDVKQIAAAALGVAGQVPADGWAAAGRQFRERTLQAAATGFSPDQSGVPLGRFLCWSADALVKRLIPHAVAEAGADSLQLAWVATGGYGRRLMSPGSTVRLVVLHNGREAQAARAASEALADLLHQAGCRTACAARTVSQVVERMRQDPVGAVAMLQTRRVAGSRNLHEELRGALVRRFLPRSWGSFAESALGEVLSRRDPLTSSPYCTEPNLKEGAGCLRDIGTAQKLDDALSALPGLPAENGAALLTDSQRAELSAALDFLLSARNRLHLLHGDPANLLQRRFQGEVAAALGYADDAALMRELFAHTGRVCAVLRGMQEQFCHLHRVAWRRSAQPPRRDLGEGFVEVEGRIYSAVEPAFPPQDGAPRMTRLFLLSQRRHLPVSQQLLQQVRDSLDAAGARFRCDEDAGRALLDLLAGSVGVAERIGWMRDCGLLQACLPELAPLMGGISPREAGEFTLDEHAVEALRVIDSLGHATEPGTL